MVKSSFCSGLVFGSGSVPTTAPLSQNSPATASVHARIHIRISNLRMRLCRVLSIQIIVFLVQEEGAYVVDFTSPASIAQLTI